MAPVTDALLGVVALITAILEPLTASALEGPATFTATLTVGVLTAALTALAHSHGDAVALTAGVTGGQAARRRRAVPVPTDRVTDPVHHPLRPRAPGSV